MNMPELKRRYESGERQQKRIEAQIKQQLKRQCSKYGCHESLSFERATRILCSAHKGTSLGKKVDASGKRKTVSEVRKENRLRKERYYKKHGITFKKTIRNRNYKVPDGKPGVTYAGQTLLYENYKEPLKAIEKGKGYGYYGTVAMTSDKQYVQCHICGNLFPAVGQHLRKHKISAERYKEIYKLSAQTALISEPVRRQYQEKVVASIPNKGEGLPDWLKEYNRKVQSGEIVHKGSKRREGGMSLEKRNELGLCPDQVLEKIKDLAEELGKPPSHEDFDRKYKGRYKGSIIFQHGSWSKAVKKACGITREELRRPDGERLIQELRDFYDTNGRIPMTSDFNRGMLRDKNVYIRKFGSLNNARIEAGINAVIPMPFKQVVEMTPEQYLEYKNGEGSKFFEHPYQKSSKRRRKLFGRI